MFDVPQKPTKPNHIYLIYVYKRIWLYITSNGLYAIKPNQNI